MNHLTEKLMSHSCAQLLKKIGIPQHSEFFYVTINGNTALINRLFKAQLIKNFGLKKEEFTSCFTIDELVFLFQKNKDLKEKIVKGINCEPAELVLHLVQHFSVCNFNFSINKPTDLLESFLTVLEEIKVHQHIAPPDFGNINSSEDINNNF